MLTPPAPAGVAENSSSPVDEFSVIELWCMFTFTSKQYCNCVPAGRRNVLVWQEPGSRRVPPNTWGGGDSPWPTLMPPESVPELLRTRLLAIWMLCPQPCTKMPPPPCELLVTVRPSMLAGLQ